MSTRQSRITRLVKLREQQHLLAELELQAARHTLQAEDVALASARERVQATRDQLGDAEQDGTLLGWLSHCAEGELCTLAVHRHVFRRVGAGQQVEEAALRETSARVMSRQMEETLQHMRDGETRTAMRAEQVRMDEITRNLSSFSTLWKRSGSSV